MLNWYLALIFFSRLKNNTTIRPNCHLSLELIIKRIDMTLKGPHLVIKLTMSFLCFTKKKCHVVIMRRHIIVARLHDNVPHGTI
jgi:hypothetical protein